MAAAKAGILDAVGFTLRVQIGGEKHSLPLENISFILHKWVAVVKLIVWQNHINK